MRTINLQVKHRRIIQKNDITGAINARKSWIRFCVRGGDRGHGGNR